MDDLANKTKTIDAIVPEPWQPPWQRAVKPEEKEETDAASVSGPAPALTAADLFTGKADASFAAPGAFETGGAGAKNGPHLHALLKQSIAMKASDIMIAPGRKPSVRVDGDMTPMEMFPTLGVGDADLLLRSILKESQLRELDERWELDCSYELEGYRFRVNVHKQLRGLAAVFRLLGESILTPGQIGLSDAIMRLTDLEQGLVLVTGPTGSGKTTTLATMIDKINRTERYHILTIEDPVEIVHEENYRCVITHRELGSHTQSFNNALRSALREAPDVILVGEMRDLETIALALTAAETGHLVFATLHTRSASETVNRVIDVFPSGQQPMVRSQLASSLKAVVSQKLLKRIPKGRVAAREVMLGTNAIANQIRTNKTHEIYSSIQSGFELGMMTMEQSLAELVLDGVADHGEAYDSANDKEVFGSYISSLGARRKEGGKRRV
jgi:twitching motility protein PilT